MVRLRESHFKTLFCVLFALASLVQPAIAQQTPFQRLFDPTTTLSIILEMSLTTWSGIANWSRPLESQISPRRKCEASNDV
jgi:hypothetical protein